MTEQSTTARDQIFAKIAKLMELANHARSNEHEAALAASKVQDLMQQWAITETELSQAAGGAAAVKYVVETVPFLVTKVWKWEDWLCVHVANAFFVHPVRSDSKRIFSLCGREDDAKMSAFVFSQLRTTLDTMARSAFQVHAADYKRRFGVSVYKKSNAQAYRGKWLTSWMDGAVAVVGRRLKEQNQKFAESSSMSMVIVETRPQEAEAYALTVFSNIRPGKVSKLTLFQEAQMLGRKAGETVQINKGLAASNPQKLQGE